MNWDHEFDVVVVGSGAGGMTAALSAQAKGLSALVIEKDAYYGGTSAVSGGGIWVPCNHQIERLGGNDSFEDALAYMQALTGGEVEPQRLETYLRRAREMVLFMRDRYGIEFCSVPIYPDYFPDVEGSRPGWRTMEPAPFDASKLGPDLFRLRPSYPGTLALGRLAMTQVEAHTLLTREPGWVRLLIKLIWTYFTDFRWRRKTRRDRRQTLGQAMVGALRHAMNGEGLPLWLNCGMDDLIEDEAGRIVGVCATREGRALRIRARRGVVLACGGFESNQTMREEYLPKPTDARWTAAPGCNHGDGIRAGRSRGARLKFMDLTWGTPTVNVPGEVPSTGLFVERALPHCVMVNGQGRRFIDEAAPYTEIIYAMYADHEKTGCSVPCWFICDSQYRKKYPLGPMMPAQMTPDSKLPENWEDDVYYKADTLEQLAERIGVDYAGLRETIDHFNECCDTGEDDEFHKGENVFDRYYGDNGTASSNPCLGRIGKGPFYALRLNPGELGTKGGLDADHAGRVLREDGSILPGLYATGNCSAALMGRTYAGPGATLGPAMTFGYLAALDMASEDASHDAGIATAA